MCLFYKMVPKMLSIFVTLRYIILYTYFPLLYIIQWIIISEAINQSNSRLCLKGKQTRFYFSEATLFTFLSFTYRAC